MRHAMGRSSTSMLHVPTCLVGQTRCVPSVFHRMLHSETLTAGDYTPYDVHGYNTCRLERGNRRGQRKAWPAVALASRRSGRPTPPPVQSFSSEGLATCSESLSRAPIPLSSKMCAILSIPCMSTLAWGVRLQIDWPIHTSWNTPHCLQHQSDPCSVWA